MSPQPLVDPMIFLTLIPAIVFISFTLVFIRWPRVKASIVQARQKAPAAPTTLPRQRLPK